MVQSSYYVDPSEMSDEDVYQAEQAALKAEQGDKYVPTKRWWTPKGKTTFANQKQPAKKTTSPYGYSQAMGPELDSQYKTIGSPMGSGIDRAERLRASKLMDAKILAASGGGGGGSYRPRTSTGSVQTTETTYKGTRPEADLPEYDKSKIKAYRQKIAGPAMRRLRSEMRRVLSASYENPNVRRHILRGALEGYGIGLGSIQSEAETAAGQRYSQEYGQEYQRALQNYQIAMQAYLSTAKTTTTQKSTYGYDDTGDPSADYRAQQLRYTSAATGGRL